MESASSIVAAGLAERHSKMVEGIDPITGQPYGNYDAAVRGELRDGLAETIALAEIARNRGKNIDGMRGEEYYNFRGEAGASQLLSDENSHVIGEKPESPQFAARKAAIVKNLGNHYSEDELRVALDAPTDEVLAKYGKITNTAHKAEKHNDVEQASSQTAPNNQAVASLPPDQEKLVNSIMALLGKALHGDHDSLTILQSAATQDKGNARQV